MVHQIRTGQKQFLLPSVAGALLILLFSCMWSIYGPHIIDDAYITFRYARNISRGEGLVYNPGERVQGASTPLYTLILGFLGFLGINIKTGAIFLGIMASIAILVLLIIIGISSGYPKAGWLAAFVITSQLIWILISVSGMETMLYSLVILSGLYFASRKKWRWVGLHAGLAMLLRNDGLILAFILLAAVIWKAGLKSFVRETVKALLIYLPWFIFACIYFGSPLPHSVKAKTVINNLTWMGLAKQYYQFLSLAPLWWMWLPLSVYGTLRMVKKSSAYLVFPSFIFLYLFAFIVSRRPVAFYPWYLVPLFPPVFFTASVGLREIIEKILNPERKNTGKASHRWISKNLKFDLFLLAGALIVLFQMMDILSKREQFGKHILHREEKYRRAAKIFSEEIKPGDTVYVGELGAIGWYLPEAYIIDSAGLISPKVYEIRKRDREAIMNKGESPEDYLDGTEQVTLSVIEELRPDYIISRREFLFLKEVSDDPFFKKRYEEILEEKLKTLGQRAFKRK